MALERLHYETRESWLAGRTAHNGIGGSEAAGAVGLSPWQTPIGLWRLKLGVDEPKDLSDNPAVQRGIRMEGAVRKMFAALHPEMAVSHYPYDILYQTERPWLFATLDGQLVDEHARYGILEIKTAQPTGRMGWAEWADGHIPVGYMIQCLHQLLATGWDFVYLFAALWGANGDITLREYRMDREDHEDDLRWLLDKETEFWERHVIQRVPPATPLRL